MTQKQTEFCLLAPVKSRLLEVTQLTQVARIWHRISSTSLCAELAKESGSYLKAGLRFSKTHLLQTANCDLLLNFKQDKLNLAPLVAASQRSAKQTNLENQFVHKSVSHKLKSVCRNHRIFIVIITTSERLKSQCAFDSRRPIQIRISQIREAFIHRRRFSISAKISIDASELSSARH